VPCRPSGRTGLPPFAACIDLNLWLQHDNVNHGRTGEALKRIVQRSMFVVLVT
jgi:hypothetical protein